MNFTNKLINWYFNKKSLPYWCVFLFDCAIVFFSFLLVYQQTTRQTVLWCAAILAMNLLYAWLVWRLGGNRRKKRNVDLLFRS